MSFKIPSSIPQDLLLIQEMVAAGVHRPEETSSKTDIDSSDSEDSSSSDADTDSMNEDELKVDESLQVAKKDSDTEEIETLKDAEPVPSEDSDSDSSEDDSDSEDDIPHFIRNTKNDASDDEDDEVTGVSIPASGIRSKNEVPEAAIVPEVQTVGADERLEKVGEIMSVFESVVVVRGIPSETKNAAERALDSESLLVFEDRKVLGYVHETFGPTQQPFYQIKFPSSSAINSELVTVGKTVFHLPDRSNFVFASQLRMFKGSDASNVHDEEVNEDELEFSDDEAEQAFKRQRKRNGRSSSVASSRFSTPLPSHMRDQELMEESAYDASPYDEYGPYNMDSEAGPSRPAPLPYDDPYQDAPRPASPTSSVMSDAPSQREDRPMGYGDRANGRGRGRGRGRGGARGRGRDGGAGFRGREDRRGRGGRGGGGGGDSRPPYEQRGRERERSVSNPPALPRPLSPTSLAIARATGQYSDGSVFQQTQAMSIPPSPREPQSAPWNTQGTFVQYAASTQGYQAQPYQEQSPTGFVQPHINPRFASMFGINMNFMQQQQQQYSPYQPSMTQNGFGGENGWNGSWSAPTAQSPGNMTKEGSGHNMDTSGDSRS